MRGLFKVVLLAGVLGAAAVGCGRAGNPAAPRPEAPAVSTVVTEPGDGDVAPADGASSAEADSTGRWGGGIGSGT